MTSNTQIHDVKTWRS